MNEKQPRLVPVDEKKPLFDPQSPGDDDRFLGNTIVHVNPIRRYKLDHTIQFLFRETYLLDGSPINQSILHLTKGRQSHEWCGPVVVMRRDGTYLDHGWTEDITAADLRHIADYLDWYGSGRSIDSLSWTQESVSPMVKAVKVACNGDQNTLHAKPLAEVNLPLDHPAVNHGTISGISKRLGFTLAFYKLYASPRIKNITGSLCRESVTFAMMDDNPDSESWAFAPLQWTGGRVPSCIVIRKDQKPLSAQQIEAFLYFCDSKLQSLFEDSLGAGWTERTKDEVLQYMNKLSFDVFFEEYRRKRIKELRGDSESNVWTAVRCPTRV